MKGAFWNIRGLNKSGRMKCLADFISSNKLDFVGIQETKKNSFTDGFLEAVSRNMTWHYVPAKGTAGGILVGLIDACFFHFELPRLSVWDSHYDQEQCR
jgi:exonuclease III